MHTQGLGLVVSLLGNAFVRAMTVTGSFNIYCALRHEHMSDVSTAVIFLRFNAVLSWSRALSFLSLLPMVRSAL